MGGTRTDVSGLSHRWARRWMCALAPPKGCRSALGRPLVTACGSPTGDVVDVYQREFLALRDRLHAAEQESLKRSKELNLVLDEIKRAMSERQALRDRDGNRTWGRLTGEGQSGWQGRWGWWQASLSHLSFPDPSRGPSTEAVEHLAQARAAPAHRLSPPAAPASQGKQPAAGCAGGPRPHWR